MDMDIKEVKPFNGIILVTTKADENEVSHLCNKLGLVCNDCGGKRFKVNSIANMTLEIISDKKNLIITNISCDRALANRVEQCANCGSKNFRPVAVE